MVNGTFLKEALRLGCLALCAALLGAPFGYAAIGFALGALVYGLWQALQLSRLGYWLGQSEHNTPPESHGLWAEVFDKLYHQQRQQLGELDRLNEATNYITEGAASLSDGVVMVDAQGNIVWCNAATERLVGVRSPEDQGTPLVNLLRNPDFIGYFQTGDYETGIRMASPSAPTLLLRVEISVFGGGNRLVFIRDITQIEQLERMRVDFIANVSHELRTPLTVITGYLESLASMEEGVPLATLQRALAQMQAQSERMQALVSDITLLSRLESEPASEQPSLIDVHALISMLVDDAQCSVGKDRQLKMQLDSHDQLLGEEGAIHSAFGNLIVNACKYTESGGEISVRWYRRGDDTVFEVQDNGVGIDESDLPHLSKRFYRVDKSRSTNSGGTGLGLAIVKHALLRHDAQLEVESELGSGSVFRCVFPPHSVQAVAS